MTFFDRYLNWKKNPASVWYIAIPLVLLGYSILLAKAVIEYQKGDPWYLVIWAAGASLLVFSLWRMQRIRERSLIWVDPESISNKIASAALWAREAARLRNFDDLQDNMERMSKYLTNLASEARRAEKK